jgi:hypothetical protein
MTLLVIQSQVVGVVGGCNRYCCRGMTEDYCYFRRFHFHSLLHRNSVHRSNGDGLLLQFDT